jgi:hypothetical protein
MMETLEIKQVGSYTRARYPRLTYRENRKFYRGNLLAAGMTSAALLALLGSACVEQADTRPGLVGPPPMPPNYITENEARSVINEVFARNGITLDTDVPLDFLRDNKDRVILNLDGFNSKLNIGYEYIFADDAATFTPEVITDLEKVYSTRETGPFIITASPPQSPEELESLIQEFIAGLRSKGIL